MARICSRVVEAACWTHARRYFHDELPANDSPLAREAIERMQPLFAIETEIHGQPPEARINRRLAVIARRRKHHRNPGRA